MKKWMIIVVLVAGAVISRAAVVISTDFTTNSVHLDGDLVAGSTTDVGNVVWRSNASGKFRYNDAKGDGGAAVPQNNLVDSSPRLYLDCDQILNPGNVTTLSLKAQVVDCRIMNFGFGTDDLLMSGSTHAFWVRIDPNGTVDAWKRVDGGNIKILDGVQVKATNDDVLDITLGYDQAANQVWASVVGGASNAVLVATDLGFVPTFDQFNFELQNEVGDRINAGYFDDVVVDVLALAPYDGWTASFGLSGSPDADPDYDFDGDGLDNLYEYGLGGDPTNSVDRGISPVFLAEGEVATYIYPQRADPDSGIGYHLELNGNLVSGSWIDAGYSVSGTNVTGGTFDYVTNIADTVDNQKYIRLIIE